MRTLLIIAALAVPSFGTGAQDPKSDPKAPDAKKDYAEFSKLIHAMVVKELPKEFEDKSGWGQLAPLTEPLRFPNLPRTRVRVGDKEGYPDGLWRKFKVRINEPAKDLKIDVREFAKIDLKTYKLAVDTEVALAGEGEVQNWQKGLALGKVNAQADALIGLGTFFDISVTLSTKKFPPELVVEPKLTDLKIDLKNFILRRVWNPTLNVSLEGESAQSAGDQLKDALRSFIKSSEPDIKKRANDAIEQALKEGKGNISAGALFKMAPAAEKK